MQMQKIALIGTGNVAFHLGKALAGAGAEIVYVAGRNAARVQLLADTLHCTGFPSLQPDLPPADLYLIAIKDDAIREVAAAIYTPGKCIVHTSGSVASDVLQFDGNRYGVFYPMQTFSHVAEPRLDNALFCITGSDTDTEQALAGLARKLSTNVIVVNDMQRGVLHTGAVWANNFTNHMFDIADQLLREHDLSFALLLPLIGEEIAKIAKFPPHELQTGPARRGDYATMYRHVKIMENHPDWIALYNKISESILERFLNK